MNDNVDLGRRIRELRRRRGLSLETLAGLAGMSTSMLSYVERGLRALERRSHIEGLAYGLRVEPSELLGLPYPATDPERSSAQGYVSAIRDALVGTEIGYAPTEPTRPLADLVQATEQSRTALCAQADYTAASDGLAELLVELHAYTMGAEQQEIQALRALVLACFNAACVAKEQGYLDLAWIAAERARQAAVRLDDPVRLGLATIAMGYALESHRLSLMAVTRALAALQPAVGSDPQAMQVYGQLHLRAAYCNIIFGAQDDMRAHLDEAAELAQRTGDCTDFGLFFGPTNLDIWKLTLAVEQGEGARVTATVDEQVRARVAQMPSRWRQAMFHNDLGRALAQARREPDALREFIAAEQLAPVYVRNNPFAREAVLDIRDRARRSAVGRDLSGLIYRMGLT